MMCKKVTVFYNKIILIISKILHCYYTIYMNKQLVFGVIAVVFATALISSLVVDQASASRNKAPRGNSDPNGSGQSIAQNCEQSQSSSVVTAGAGSGVTGSGNNVAACTNTNNGGNAAA